MKHTRTIGVCIATALVMGLTIGCQGFRDLFDWNPDQRALAVAVVDSLEARGKIGAPHAAALRNAIEKTDGGIDRQEVLQIALDASVASGDVSEADALLIDAAIRVFIRNDEGNDEPRSEPAEEAGMPDGGPRPPDGGGQ